MNGERGHATLWVSCKGDVTKPCITLAICISIPHVDDPNCRLQPERTDADLLNDQRAALDRGSRADGVANKFRWKDVVRKQAIAYTLECGFGILTLLVLHRGLVYVKDAGRKTFRR